MRSERLYLADILDPIAAVERFTAGMSLESFLNNELAQSAVLQKLSIIGEAAARLSQQTRDSTQGIPWPEIVGFRNVAVHAYFSVDWSVVYFTVSDELPNLKSAVADLFSRSS